MSLEEFGSYVVLEQLGVGGMASVHVAESRSMGGFRKRVALKRLLPHAAENPDLVRSFLDEARLNTYLKHPNVAQIYDFGQVGDVYFMAMELVAGPTLNQLARQCDSTVGIIPFPITMNILIQVLDALDYAHNLRDEHGKRLGIIHRDVSPPNIVVSNQGLVKLIDFGIAKAASSSVQTQVGTVKGKFSYMAPEYLREKLDHRVDIWAVGVIAHELLTNRRLFDANDDFKVIDMVKELRIDPPSRRNVDVPPDLDAVVMTALQRDPDQRWQSAAAMRTALANAAAELQTVVTNAQLIEWVEWTFSQKPPGEGSDLSQLIQILETPSRPSARLSNPDEPTVKGRKQSAQPVKSERYFARALNAFSTPKAGIAAVKRAFSTPQVGAAMVKRNSSGLRFVTTLLFLLLLGAIGVGIAAWFASWPFDLQQLLLG
ncbi:MAG TPA: serine/threonine-protein kinase [Kofleriaceae bacterium]|nr:serine/threonine-protein kinase [Kofleriaceae bacterium]